jgi:PmbA protein
MNRDVLDTAREALARAACLPGEVEVFAEESRTTAIKVYAREVESVVTAESRGLGVRYIEGGRGGYAYTADLSAAGMDRVLSEARANADASEPDEFSGLPAPSAAYPDVPGLWRPGVAATSVARKITLALEAEAVALAEPEVGTVEETVYADGESRTAIVSSMGLEAWGERTHAYSYLSAHAHRGSEVRTGLGITVGREPGDLEVSGAAREAAARARALLGSRPCATGVYTVVFDREVMAALLSVASSALTAEAVQKGRSLFAGRVGQEVAAAGVTLVDHGLHPDGLETSPFDDEGAPRQVTTLIGEGRLRGFLHSTYTARKDAALGERGAGSGGRSTGNAARASYRGAPGVSASNLVLAEGEGTLADLLARVGRGLYVVNINGLHSGANPITGQFSVGAEGHLIEGGALGASVKEVTIASDLLSLLLHVRDRAADARWVPLYGSALAPSVAISNVTVSGV